MSKTKRTSTLVTIFFLLPAVILFFCFIVYPVFNTIVLSFQSWKGIYGAPKDFVGWSNYLRVFRSKNFWNALLNSSYFIIGGFGVLLPLSFGLALLITSKLRGRKFMKTAYFMPVMLSTTAVALMWSFILHPTFGLLNEFLRAVGLEVLAKEWLSTPTLNVWSVIMVNTWMYAGYNMLIFVAGLVTIPQELYEAGEIDGCTGWKKIRYISIPLSKESFKIFAILCITGCLKTFDLIWAMTRGGPNNTSEVPATLLYNEAFTFKNFGQSSSIGVILLVLGLTLSVLLNKALESKKE